tara:strand:+ start:25 stop:3210 length:3186 start_codon:yes stop_codon:yes gene_type:complete
MSEGNIPSINDFLNKNEDLPSVEDFIEGHKKEEIVEEKQIPIKEEVNQNDLLLENAISKIVDSQNLTEVLRLIGDIRKDIPEIPEVKYYDTELKELSEQILEVQKNISEVPEVKYYDDEIKIIKEEFEEYKSESFLENAIKIQWNKWFGETFNKIEDRFENIKSNMSDEFNVVNENVDVVKFEKNIVEKNLEDTKNNIKNFKESVADIKSKIYKELENSSTRIYELKLHLKDDDRKLKKQLLGQYNLLKENIEKKVEDFNQKNIEAQNVTTSSLKEYFDEVKESINNLPEIKYYDDEIEQLNKQFEEIKSLKSVVQELKTKQTELNEGLLNITPDENNSDPLTPINQDFPSLEEFQKQYKLFVMRVQQQLATLGGGGEVRVLKMDDVDTTDLGDEKVLSYDASSEKLKFVDQSGGSGITTDNIRTNTNATFLQNVNVSGTVTATSYVGNGAGLTGVASTENIRTNTNATFLQNINVSGTTTTGTVSGFTHLIAPFGSTKTITVKVASKTSAHRYNGSGSSNGYKLDDIESPFLTLTPGRTYKFDQADSSNSGHPLRFYLEADKTTAYSTNVTTSGTPGSSGAYTQIVVTDSTPQILHYQCSSHAYMGNSVNCNSNQSDLSSLNASNLSSGTIPDARFPSTLPAVNGSQLTGISAGAGVTGITIKEEGSVVGTAASIKSINFVGSTVTATASGTDATVTVSGGGGASMDANSNFVVGTDAGNSLSGDENNNIFIGDEAGYSVDYGGTDGNICIGYKAGRGVNYFGNTFIGHQAAYQATGTTFNTTVLGASCAQAYTAMSSSVLIGAQAASSSSATTFNSNTVVGMRCGKNVYMNNTLYGKETCRNSSGSIRYINAFGEYAARSVVGESVYLNAFGHESSYSNTSGANNSSFGHKSAYNTNTGSDNTSIGYQAGDLITTGDNNISIGKDSDPSAADADNEITLGNSSNDTIRCNTQTISSLSDARDKTDVNKLEFGLDFVDSLKPVKFKWKTRDGNSKDGSYEAGFIAQDFQKVQKDNDADYLKLVHDHNPEKLEASYGKLVPVLVRAIQELKQEIEELKSNV